jgi:isocitrate dehydrogenase
MIKITVAKGDGIGPKLMDASLGIILKSGAKIEDGEKAYLPVNTSGIEASSWDIIRENKIVLKAPITSPLGGGCKRLIQTTII